MQRSQGSGTPRTMQICPHLHLGYLKGKHLQGKFVGLRARTGKDRPSDGGSGPLWLEDWVRGHCYGIPEPLEVHRKSFCPLRMVALSRVQCPGPSLVVPLLNASSTPTFSQTP